MVPQDALGQISIGISRITGEKVTYFNVSSLNYESGVPEKVASTASRFKRIIFPFLPLLARASCYQCDTQYRGPFPQSENESQAMGAAIQALNESLRMYITVHSYSQMWLTRWGYSSDETEDFDDQVK